MEGQEKTAQQNVGQEQQKDQTQPESKALEVLVDKLAEIEEKIEQNKGGERYLTLDDLQELLSGVEDAQEEAKEQGSKKEIVELEALKQELQQQIAALQQQLLEMRVMQEVERCRQKYSDFDNYKQEMLELSVQYPNASVEDLYHLAKAKYGEKSQKSEKEGRTLSLDELKAMLKAQGEKPTGTTGQASTKGQKPLSIAEAAAMAAEEVFKNMK